MKKVNRGSFRDPSGQVFRQANTIYRTVYPAGASSFEKARDQGIYEQLIDQNLLLSFSESPNSDGLPPAAYYLRHPTLPMISYPWEWPFSMLKSAALLHLEIMGKIIAQGFWLRDASAFNVQYDGNRLLLIDLLSIGQREANKPWVAYNQFCRHFLAPLALAAYVDIRTLSFWRTYLDGFPLDLTSRLLSFSQKCRPRLFLHLVLHAYFQKIGDQSLAVATTRSKTHFSDVALSGLIGSLAKTVTAIRWKHPAQLWEKYAQIRTYQQQDIAQKSKCVEQVVQKFQPKLVWDLGGNTGEFSIIAAAAGAFVVSIDMDHGCTEYLYQKITREQISRILPLTMDLANPSPGLGWSHHERTSLSDRGPADLVLALALIHHLVFSSCVPLNAIAEWFASLSKYLLVEFIPLDDPMVAKLRMHHPEHHEYSLPSFQENFCRFFDCLDQVDLGNGRILFIMQKKEA